ncbi:MAG: hypothetical protein Q9187_002606 [Circinaria calcarea]
MAFPLRSILNTRDVSPTAHLSQTLQDRGPGHIQDHAAGPSHVSDPQVNPLLPITTTNKSAHYGVLPPITFSPDRGALYKRRASRSPRHKAAPPTPPTSDQPVEPLYWYDAAPPTHEMDFTKFSIFKSLLNYPELVHEVAKYLDIDTLISLYAISKDFHDIVNGRFTAMILAQSLGKAAESSRVFLFKCYKNLCIRDPAARKNEEVENQIRRVPSFRWLRFIFFREKVVDDIITSLAVEGHRLPRGASLAIRKIWFLMDISDNARRIALLHNKDIWTNKDLFLATMFFMKLDMRLTDPVNGTGEQGLRKMLLAQRSLSTLARVLKREEMLTQLEMIRMFVKWNHQPLPRHRGMSILGVPARQVGRGMREGWGSGSRNILRPDELVMREAIRRNLNMHRRYLDMMLWGHVDHNTFEDIRPLQVSEDEGEEMEAEEGEETDLEGREPMDLADLDLPG